MNNTNYQNDMKSSQQFPKNQMSKTSYGNEQEKQFEDGKQKPNVKQIVIQYDEKNHLVKQNSNSSIKSRKRPIKTSGILQNQFSKQHQQKPTEPQFQESAKIQRIMQKVNYQNNFQFHKGSNPNHMSETNLVKGKCQIDDFINQYDKKINNYDSKDLYLLQNTNALEQIYNLQQQSNEYNLKMQAKILGKQPDLFNQSADNDQGQEPMAQTSYPQEGSNYRKSFLPKTAGFGKKIQRKPILLQKKVQSRYLKEKDSSEFVIREIATRQLQRISEKQNVLEQQIQQNVNNNDKKNNNKINILKQKLEIQQQQFSNIAQLLQDNEKIDYQQLANSMVSQNSDTSNLQQQLMHQQQQQQQQYQSVGEMGQEQIKVMENQYQDERKEEMPQITTEETVKSSKSPKSYLSQGRQNGFMKPQIHSQAVGGAEANNLQQQQQCQYQQQLKPNVNSKETQKSNDDLESQEQQMQMEMCQDALQNQINQQGKVVKQMQQETRVNTAHLRQGPQHALMSWGPVDIIKERVIRNFDHLEILKEIQRLANEKKQDEEKQKQQNKSNKDQINIMGYKLNVPLIDKKVFFGQRNKMDQYPVYPNIQVISDSNLDDLFKYKKQHQDDQFRSSSQLQMRQEKAKLMKGLNFATSNYNIQKQNIFLEEEAKKKVYDKIKFNLKADANKDKNKEIDEKFNPDQQQEQELQESQQQQKIQQYQQQQQQQQYQQQQQQQQIQMIQQQLKK